MTFYHSITFSLPQSDDVKSLLHDAMIQDPAHSTPPINLTISDNKSHIAYKGLTAAGASLLASEMILGDGGEGISSLFNTGSSVVGGVLNPRGGAADGSDQGNMASQKNAGTCKKNSVLNCMQVQCIIHVCIVITFPIINTFFCTLDPAWKSMTVHEVLDGLQLVHLTDLFEREQVCVVGVSVGVYILQSCMQ